ncbi:MAG: DUF5615 family PIN-like protein [Candidatus Rokubacteria bacterium]|nr:DUF5615 family PIN-like protein [Candidatus Rokubacteria bacterium]
MRILLDENMPESVRRALRDLGHEVDSVVSLRLKGLDNSRLHREITHSYDLFFTRDREFAEMVRAVDAPTPAKVILVTLQQEAGPVYARAFIAQFQRTDWSIYPNASEWPAAG